jgi:hypothetical protein
MQEASVPVLLSLPRSSSSAEASRNADATQKQGDKINACEEKGIDRIRMIKGRDSEKFAAYPAAEVAAVAGLEA